MQRGFSGIVLVFIVLLIVAGGFGGFYFYNQSKLSSDNVLVDDSKAATTQVSDVTKGKQLSSPLEPTLVPSPTPSNGVSQTYSSSELAFSLSHPSNFEVALDDKYSFMTGQTTKAVTFSKTRTNLDHGFEIFVQSEKIDSAMTADQLIDQYLATLEPGPQSAFVSDKVTKSRKPYQLGQISGVSAMFGWDSDFMMIISVHNGRVYTIQYMDDNGSKVDPEAEQEVNTILKTFAYL